MSANTTIPCSRELTRYSFTGAAADSGPDPRSGTDAPESQVLFGFALLKITGHFP